MSRTGCVGILGSCVTRDATRKDRFDLTRVPYFARTSLVSLMSEPMDPARVGAWQPYFSEYEWKFLLKDFRREFWSQPFETLDLLVIDLLSECRNLLEWEGRYATSGPIIEAKARPHYSELGYRLVQRHDPGVDDLWFGSAGAFFERLSSRMPLSKVVLNQTYWADRFVDPDYVAPNPWWTRGDGVEYRNDQLRAYYGFITRTFGIDVIEPDPRFMVMQPNHPYGEAPYHYVPDYTDDLARKLAVRLDAG